MGYFLLILINLLFPIAGLGFLLYFFISPRRNLLKNLKAEVRERFTWSAIKGTPKNALWIHAASVGEIKSVLVVAEKLKEIYKKPLIITTTTQAGRQVALKSKVCDKALLMPLDFYFFIKRFLKFYNPSKLFIVESDLWPNLIVACSNNNVPVCVINGRLSQRSFKRYKLISPLIKLILRKINLICAQTQDIAQRYIASGASEEKVFNTGNIKYDMLTQTPANQEEAKEIIKKLYWQNAFVLTCGSTHAEEEDLIIKTAKKLSQVKFIIAPRHLERKNAIIENLKKSNLSFSVFSKIKESPESETQILLVDTMGMLGAFYTTGTLAFIGGTISKKGGHNFLEAAILGKAILSGPYFYNTPEVATKLFAEGGGVKVGKTTFLTQLKKFVNNTSLAKQAGAKAQEVALSFKGATDKTISIIKEYGK
jgi:3-deoxy-D-manno-octulosonic-acid transferase